MKDVITTIPKTVLSDKASSKINKSINLIKQERDVRLYSVLKALKKNPLTIYELSVKIKVADRTMFSYVRQLESEGKIQLRAIRCKSCGEYKKAYHLI